MPNNNQEKTEYTGVNLNCLLKKAAKSHAKRNGTTLTYVIHQALKAYPGVKECFQELVPAKAENFDYNNPENY